MQQHCQWTGTDESIFASLLESIIVLIQASLDIVYVFSSSYALLVQIPVSDQVLTNFQCLMFTEVLWQSEDGIVLGFGHGIGFIFYMSPKERSE